MEPTDPRTDAELLVAARADPEAFGVFYRRHATSLLGFFRRRVATADVAFDLTAETFAAALQALPRYEPRPEPAAAWLYGIARNKHSEALRRGRVADLARRALEMEPIVLDDDAIERLERDAAGTPALAALADLPAEQREAIRARHVEGLEYEEIAARLRCSESVVRKRVSRGLHTLRTTLKEAGR